MRAHTESAKKWPYKVEHLEHSTKKGFDLGLANFTLMSPLFEVDCCDVLLDIKSVKKALA